MSDYFLEVQHLTKYFPLNNDVISRLTGKTHTLKAVDDISSFLQQGETLGLVGESSCGNLPLCPSWLATAGSHRIEVI